MNKKIKNNMRNTLKDGTSKMNLIEKKQKEGCILKKSLIERMSENLDVSFEQEVYFSLEEFKEEISNLFSYNIMNLPLKSSGLVSLSNSENELSNNSGCFCGIFNQTTENIVSLLYKNLSVKSQSLVTNILCSDLENPASSPFESFFGLKITSKSFLRNYNNSFLTFSSSRNLSSLSFDVDDDIVTPFSEASCILQSCFNMLFCERYKEGVKNFFDRSSIFQHLQNLPDHNSCSFESGLAMTNFSVCNNEFIYFNSHDIKDDNKIFKSFDLQIIVFIFEIQNDGNCLLNISLNAIDLWTSIFGNSSYYQFKFDNHTLEKRAFNWTQVPSSTQVVMVELNWSDANDLAEMDLLVTVPSQEPAGDKSSTLHFTAELGE